MKEAVMDQQKGLEEYLLYIDQGNKIVGNPTYNQRYIEDYDIYYSKEDEEIIQKYTDNCYPFYYLPGHLIDQEDWDLDIYIDNVLYYSLRQSLEKGRDVFPEQRLYPYFDKYTLDVIKHYDSELVEGALPVYVSKSFMFKMGLMDMSPYASNYDSTPDYDGPFIVEGNVDITVGCNQFEKIHFKAQVMGILPNCPGHYADMYLKYDLLEQLIQDQLGYLPYTDAYILLSKQPNLEQRIDLTTLSQKSYLIQEEWMPTYDKTIEGRLNEHNRKQ